MHKILLIELITITNFQTFLVQLTPHVLYSTGHSEHNLHEFARISYELFVSLPKITNFVYNVHIRIHVRTRIQIRENKRKNSHAKFQKFVHEF